MANAFNHITQNARHATGGRGVELILLLEAWQTFSSATFPMGFSALSNSAVIQFYSQQTVTNPPGTLMPSRFLNSAGDVTQAQR